MVWLQISVFLLNGSVIGLGIAFWFLQKQVRMMREMNKLLLDKVIELHQKGVS